MNVLLVSQCSKRALAETRRIVDQFAERRGTRTWQTAITKQGLQTLHRLLRSRARKNTAVACHWIRGKNNTELLWIVGNGKMFGPDGAVPTDTTRRDVLRSKDENDWHSGEEIRILAGLAALFHDFGKANAAFQKKLSSRKPVADALRHEWVSLRLFEAFVGNDNDEQWLRRLAGCDERAVPSWLDHVTRDGVGTNAPDPFRRLPPLARLVGWLVVTHHRMPNDKKRGKQAMNSKALTRLPLGIRADWCGARLPDGGTERGQQPPDVQACWSFEKGVPTMSAAWQKRVHKYARRALENGRLRDEAWLGKWDAHVLHLARMVLILADHHYSSLVDPSRRVQGSPGFALAANTRRDTGELNQALDEHLIGVEMHTGRIAKALQTLEQALPRIARHKGFTRRSSDKRFRWQDKAFDLATSQRVQSEKHGFFGINMASTGCGKTLANGRIMYALASPRRGARFSIALGLRSLTLQTGDVYRQRLGLGPEALAVLVGGGAVRQLFEVTTREKEELRQGPLLEQSLEERCGMESAAGLLPDNSYVHFEASGDGGPLNEWLNKSRGANALLQAPVLTCTIDHLVGATEGLRGGRQIAPMLRLMTSDLVLDEPDDFGLEDLPALSRLVHWAGLLGSRVLLSSATLPPSLVEGLFEAYLEGRRVYQNNRGVPDLPLNVSVAWIDEFGAQGGEHGDVAAFMEEHSTWAARRVTHLSKHQETRRRAAIVPVGRKGGPTTEEVASELAKTVHGQVLQLHEHNHVRQAELGVRLSVGLVRMANIVPLVETIRAFARIAAPEQTQIHICSYHSQYPLLLRSELERRLDRVLNRKDPAAIFVDESIRPVLRQQPGDNHIFVVFATAVAEVGRDHDYDWAIVEPSSMRSIIQLAGRVRRHRAGTWDAVNLGLLEANVRHLKHGLTKPAFTKPGFEADTFRLEHHSLYELLDAQQLDRIDATARIVERTSAQPTKNLVDLEHDHLRAVMVADQSGSRRRLPVDHWWTSRAHLSGELQRCQPFRDDPRGRDRFYLAYEQGDEAAQLFRFERDGTQTPVSYLVHEHAFVCAPGVHVWQEPQYAAVVEQLSGALGIAPERCAKRFGILDLPARGDEQGWDYHAVLGFRRRG